MNRPPNEPKQRMTPFAESYAQLYFPAPSENFLKIEDSLKNNSKWGVNVSELEGRLLGTLIQMNRPQKVVEIGTLYGYSTRWFLEGLERAHKNSGQTYHLWTLEKDKDHHLKAKEFLKDFEDQGRLTLLQGDANETLKSLSHQGPFDFVFIDANKKDYPKYLEWATANLRPGGVMVADNIYLFGRIFEKPMDRDPMRDAMVSFNEQFWRENFYDCSLIPTQEGLVLGIKK